MHKVIVIGAFGKMGRISCEYLQNNAHFHLVAALGRKDNLTDALSQHQPDILIDFTLPESVYDNTMRAIEHRVRPLVGASGLELSQIEKCQQLCQQQKLGGLIVPNFSIGAILMMRLSAQVAKYMDQVRIVELHHDQKVDAPSGTARKTAELLAPDCHVSADGFSLHEPSYQGVPVHSVRLPGLFAHQSVKFNGLAETLTIKHDAHSRESMMPGLLLAAQRVLSLDHMEYGLEAALFDNAE